MLNLIKRHRLGTILVMIGAIGMAVLAVTPATANHVGCSPSFYNRCFQHGYYTNQPYNIGGQGTYVMSTGAPNGTGGMPTNDVNSFVGRIGSLLYDGSPGDKYQDTTGAAFIVNTMLGRWGSDYGNRDAGVIYARANFGEWEKRVRWYDSQGLVDWNTFRRHSNFDNTLYDRATRDDAYYKDTRPNDDQFVILFYTPNTGRMYRDFLIKKNCGNPIGLDGALQQLRPVPQPEGVIQGYKVVDPGANPTIEPPRSALITSSHKGGRSTRDNAYFFTDVPADDDGPGGPNRAFHRVAAEVPAGWRVGYNVCYSNNAAAAWKNPCDNGKDAVTWSNSVVVDVYVGNPVNVWWHYEAITPPPPPAPAVTARCVDGLVTARINWDKSARPATNYVVDIDDANTFSSFWNRSVSSSSSLPISVTNPTGFNSYPTSGSTLVLQRGQTYYVRVFYVNSGEHSAVSAPITMPSCWHFEINQRTADATFRPNPEAPTSADFDSRFGVGYSPGGGPSPQGVRLSVTRSYYIKKANGSPNVPISATPPANPDTRWFNGADINGKRYELLGRPLPGGFTIGDEVCAIITITPGSGSVDGSGNVDPATAGPAVSSGEDCDQSLIKPYFKVYGGDVSAGTAVACPNWSSGPITGSINAYSETNGKGSGVQLAAFALGTINGFSSASGRAVAPTSPKGLTFANVASSGVWGGDFSEGFCPYDYAYTQPGGTTPFNGSLTGQDSGIYSASAGATISGIVGAGKQIALYVDGDVIINNNITYAPGGGWDLTQIPNLTIVAKGNIYIDARVTEIAGVFVAQPPDVTASPIVGGEIYTCAFGGSAPSLNQLTSTTGAAGSNCRNQLTINGSFIAKRVRLLRTYGSVMDSCQVEPKGFPAPLVSPAPCPTSKMAERFIFSPVAWLNSSVRPIGGDQYYDAITTLPPVL